MDQNSQNNVLINNSRTAWPTLILMSFLSSLDNLLKDAHLIVFFKKKKVLIILR